MPDPIPVFISAGEASGEHYGALLIDALRRRLAASGHTANFFGMGGPRMEAAGLERVVPAEKMAVMGITEVVRHLPRIYREFRRLKSAIRVRRPAVAVLIDFPDIHFKLARQLHGLGIPVIYFVSPQLWAWKKERIKLVQKYVDKMLVIFPFEEQFYREHGVDAEFVGHPLADLPPPSISRLEYSQQIGVNPDRSWIGLLPGSRAKEIRDLLPTLLDAAHILAIRATMGAGPHKEHFEFILPLAPTLGPPQRKMVADLVKRYGSGLSVSLVDDARPVLHHARASVVASGTATVEAALIGSPFVVVYRVSPLTYAIARRVVTVPHVAMVNLIACDRVVPELIQNDFTPANIAQQIEPLLPEGAPRQSMKKELARIRGLLESRSDRPGGQKASAVDRVAAIVLERLELPSPVSASCNPQSAVC